MAFSWHLLSVADVRQRLASRESGLSAEEAATRLEQAGPNELEFARRPNVLARFARQFQNVLLYVLIGAATITALLGQWVDTGVILGVVLINAVIGFLQEGRAEQALEAISSFLSPRATVLRAGRPTDVDARLVVPGDVVLIAAGDRVPADLRLSYVKNLEVDESILTGESVPVRKSSELANAAPDSDDESAIDRSSRANIAFAGTLITRGQARGLVIETGTSTQLGQISHLVSSVEKLTTPLLVKIAAFGRRLAALILLLAMAIGSFGFFIRELPLADMLIAAVSIAVAAIPEGLPPVITITLAIGVQLMARRNAIVRRLPAVETLGEVNVICTDKTGTLTTNEMTVRSVLLDDHTIEVTGVGYRPSGIFLEDGDEISAELPALQELLVAAFNCNDAALEFAGADWRVVGDPMEGALLSLAEKGGLDQAGNPWQRIDAIPFESERRFMAILSRDVSGQRAIFVKGAPETILQMCEGDPDPSWLDRASAMAEGGQRVLGLARRRLTMSEQELRLQDVEGKLELLGLVGIADPPRGEVPGALQQCHDAGIRVLMITGDHASTASAICREIGLTDKGTVVTGAELDSMTADEFRAAAADVDVFARTSPEHKLRLVQSLQDDGQVVAMTGDGVNDAPALKRADIGIAMGIKGSEAARQASEIVLADDNFASIVRAVQQGRGVYDNISKSIIFLLPTSVAEALVIAGAIILGFEPPINPVQILWINMITAVTLGVALAFEPIEPHVMQRRPRAARQRILSGLAIWRTSAVSVLMLGGVLSLFFLEQIEHGTDYARTVSVNALVVFEAVYLLSSRRLHGTLFSADGLTGNRFIYVSILAVLGFQALFTYSWPLNAIFDAVPISLASWVHICLAGLALLCLVELEKLARGVWADRFHD